MDVELLSGSQSAALRRQALTYSEVGHAMTDAPPGYRHIRRTRRLPPGCDFERVSDALLSWQVQARSGLRVAASSLQVEPDADVRLRLGISRASIAIPCRVVRVYYESDRRGFAYGTLPGHPESGEEAFVLQRSDDDSVDFTIAAFSRPATVLARLGGPVTTQVQRWMTTRYLHALG